jgi:hypothetical protein
MADVLRFQPDTPELVALKFPGPGKEVHGYKGTDEMYTLADGRLMFLEIPVAEKLDALQLAPGEPVRITKLKGKPGVKDSVKWDIRRASSTPAPAVATLETAPDLWPDGADFETPASTNGNGAAAHTNGNGGAGSTNAQVKTQALDAVKTAIDACLKGSQYAASIGFPINFEHEDVRALANTILIGMQQNGGRR